MARTVALWVKRQREKSKSLPQGKKSTMTKERIQKSSKIGSVRSIVDDWSPRLKELENFQKENGHCRVPGLHTKDSETYPLACWVERQRQEYKLLREDKKGFIITEERIQKLRDIGFEWCKPWDERFQELKAFRKEHGHCRVIRVQGKDSDTHQLYHWVRNQRVQYKLLQQGKKSQSKEERIQKLNEIGFVWSFSHDWDEKFDELKAFQNEQGHCRVPLTKDTDTYQLALWVKLQRKEYKLLKQGKKSHITQERIQKLNGVGLPFFVSLRVDWDERLEALKAFQQEHGHCRVPRSKLHSENYPLNTWVLNQRRKYNMYVRLGKKSQIADERIQKLNEIGFDWSQKVTL